MAAYSCCIILLNVSYTDECQTDNGGCGQLCMDTARSYMCSCEDGYSLDSDGKGCSGKVNYDCIIFIKVSIGTFCMVMKMQ